MRLVVIVALLLGAGCRKSQPSSDGAAVAQLRVIADRMCACKDAACAQPLEAELGRWQARGVKTPDEATEKQLTELQQRFGDCRTRVTSAPPDAPARPSSPIDRFGEPTSKHVDDMIREALAWARGQNSRWRIATMRFAYVDRAGLLDPTFGELSIELGVVVLEREKRRVGSPSRLTENCYDLTLVYKKWRTRQSPCREVIDRVPSCSVVAIWKRALERHPTIDPDAIAIVTYWANDKNWIFEIRDEPTKLHIREELPDDCELAVESTESGT